MFSVIDISNKINCNKGKMILEGTNNIFYQILKLYQSGIVVAIIKKLNVKKISRFKAEYCQSIEINKQQADSIIHFVNMCIFKF